MTPRGYVYTITNVANDGVYVGITTQPPMKRWRHHVNALRRGAHTNPYLQNAWHKYGEEAFSFAVEISCEHPEHLGRWEIILLSHLKGKGAVYNINEGGVRHQVKHSSSTKRKLSARKKGELHPNSSLTPKDILLIYRMASLGRTSKDMAGEFKVSPRTIADVTSGTTWPHMYTKEMGDRIAIGRMVRVTLDAELRKEEKRVRQEEKQRRKEEEKANRVPPSPPPSRRGEAHPRARLTEASIEDIRRRANSGESGHSIARVYNMTPSYINKIIRGERWSHLGC